MAMQWLRALREATGARAAWLAIGLLSACAPALNWRETHLAQGTVRASFPCHPNHLNRQVPLAGAVLTMGLSACEAQDLVFAVGDVDALTPARVGEVLQALQRAAQTNMPALAPVESVVPQVAGMTPQPGALRASWRSRLADGRVRRVSALWVSRGTLVLQATAIGPDDRGVEQPVTTFLDSVRFAP
jgi:hypothetical protein